VVAQRLARRLCPKCKEAYVPEPGELQAIGWDLDGMDEFPQLFRPAGCGACGRTGFHGRFAIHEVLLVTEEIERMIVDRAHTEDLKKVALAQGMKTLRQAGMSHAVAGATSIEEILRVVA
jgi:type IV pilus assembly protein PilB